MSWALENLSPGQRREIAEELIAEGGGKVTRREVSRGELIGLCPLHKESNPSFSYNYEKDLYNCSSGCGGGDLIKLFGKVHGLDKKAGFKAFIKAHGLSLHPGGGKSGPGHQKTSRHHTRPQAAPEPERIIPEPELERLQPLTKKLINRLEKERGWDPELIERLGLKLWLPPGGSEKQARIAIPIRDEKERLVNIRLYLPRAAANKVLSWTMGQGKDKVSFGAMRLWPLNFEG